jgi:hypothetical protein
VAQFETPVSGLGWLPDGRMLVVSMHDRKVVRREGDGQFVEHGDISHIATWHANDMVVAADGTAYVGNFGFEIFPIRKEPRTAAIAKITATGVTSIAATGLWFPNGMVITADGRTLVVAVSGYGAKWTHTNCPTASVSMQRVQFGLRLRRAERSYACVRAGKSLSASRLSRRGLRACSAARTAGRCSFSPPNSVTLTGAAKIIPRACSRFESRYPALGCPDECPLIASLYLNAGRMALCAAPHFRVAGW